MTTVATKELDQLVRREHSDPHTVLGAHPTDGGVVVRALRPAAVTVTAHFDDGPSVELEAIHPGGVFEASVDGVELPAHYELEVDYGPAGTFRLDDPYCVHPDPRRA